MIVRNPNKARAANGIAPINHVWCRICHIMDTHFWWNCPNIRCKICHQNHGTIYCPVRLACQWCGSLNHSSVECNAALGLIHKASSKRTCFRCGRFGHIAMECTSGLTRRRRFLRRRRIGFRRRFRRRR